jgi:hypothetical protein
MGNREWEEQYEAQRFDDETHAEEENARAEMRRDAQTPIERATAPLLTAFAGAFHTDAIELTDSTLRTIGNSYASMCFAYGPTPHPRTIEALRKAMDAYVNAAPDVEPLLFPDCPF